jgi:hypothetical protein
VRPEDRRLTLSLRALQAREAGEEYVPAPRTGGPVGDGEVGGEGRRKKKGRRDDDGGGDFRAYISRGGGDFGTTLGDMFGEMFKKGGSGTSKREKRRARDEEDDDLSDFEDDFEPIAVPESDEPVLVASTEPVAEIDEPTEEAAAE